MRSPLVHMTVVLTLGVILSCGGGGSGGGSSDAEKPVLIQGSVVDLADSRPIEGALIQAVDVNGASLSTSATSGADGSFSLTVPATRDADGAPIAGSYSLRRY